MSTFERVEYIGLIAPRPHGRLRRAVSKDRLQGLDCHTGIWVCPHCMQPNCPKEQYCSNCGLMEEEPDTSLDPNIH